MSIHRSMDTLLNNLSSYFTRNSSIGCIYDSLLKLRDITDMVIFSNSGGWVVIARVLVSVIALIDPFLCSSLDLIPLKPNF